MHLVSSKRLTAADAMELGRRLGNFRDTVRGFRGKELMTFGRMRLKFAETHRKRWGSEYRFNYECILQEARESFRLAHTRGWRLP